MRSKCMRCGTINPVTKCTVFGIVCAVCGGEVYQDYLDDEEEWLPEDEMTEEESDLE